MQGPAAPGAQGLLLSAAGDAATVQAVFDALPGVDASQLQGFWRGEELPTGHPLDGLLHALGWAGKRFRADGTVDPLVFERGTRRFAVHPWLPGRLVRLVVRWPGLMKSSLVLSIARQSLPLLATRSARAHVDRVARPWVQTSAIAYDDVGIVDVLKEAGEGVVVGRMEMRGVGGYFFWLRREG